MDQLEYAGLWRLYRRNVEQDKQSSLSDLGVPLETPGMLGLSSDAKDLDDAHKRVSDLLKAWYHNAEREGRSEKDKEMSEERKIVELGLAFWQAADNIDSASFNRLLDSGVPVNFQHPRHLETALHVTCSRNAANSLTERLLKEPGVDFLLRDAFGRQAWNNAELFGINLELAEQVLESTREQARLKIGLRAFEAEYRSHLLRWINQSWYIDLAQRTLADPEA